jgi:hypothetical protein
MCQKKAKTSYILKRREYYLKFETIDALALEAYIFSYAWNIFLKSTYY